MTFKQLKELSQHIEAIIKMGCFDVKIEDNHEDLQDEYLLDEYGIPKFGVHFKDLPDCDFCRCLDVKITIKEVTRG